MKMRKSKSQDLVPFVFHVISHEIDLLVIEYFVLIFNNRLHIFSLMLFKTPWDLLTVLFIFYYNIESLYQNVPT